MFPTVGAGFANQPLTYCRWAGPEPAARHSMASHTFRSVVRDSRSVDDPDPAQDSQPYRLARLALDRVRGRPGMSESPSIDRSSGRKASVEHQFLPDSGSPGGAVTTGHVRPSPVTRCHRRSGMVTRAYMSKGRGRLSESWPPFGSKVAPDPKPLVLRRRGS